MKMRMVIVVSFCALLAFCFVLLAQEKPGKERRGQAAASAAATDTEKKNIEEYIKLLRENVGQEKDELLGAVMQLNADQAAKFWPIYEEYAAELAKLNDLKIANTKAYAREYRELTDERADQLIKEAFDFQKQQTELLNRYYERVKEALGAETAARFVQIENQLLLLHDIQIDSSLPIVG
jgi:hypothetical protein